MIRHCRLTAPVTLKEVQQNTVKAVRLLNHLKFQTFKDHIYADWFAKNRYLHHVFVILYLIHTHIHTYINVMSQEGDEFVLKAGALERAKTCQTTKQNELKQKV